MPRERNYEHGYNPPDWWFDELTRLLDAAEETEAPWTHATLAASASRVVAREPPWDATRVTRFLKRQSQTLEMTIALSGAVGIDPPFFEARSKTEAEEIVRLRSRLDASSNSETKSKLSAIQRHLDAAVREKQARGSLVSKDEDGRVRRTRRATGSRPAPPRSRS